MKITPLEIRQKTFEKKLRGYDKDEVDAFLASLSHEWENMVGLFKEQKYKIDSLEREVQKLRDVESSLFKTLKTAEDTGTHMVEQARKDAEFMLRDSHMKSEGLLNEAKMKAKSMLEDTEMIVKESLLSLKEQIHDLENEYKAIENRKSNLLHDLQVIAKDTLERVAKIESKSTPFQGIRIPKAEEIINSNGEDINFNVSIKEIVGPKAEPIVEKKIIIEAPKVEIPKVEESIEEIKPTIFELESPSISENITSEIEDNSTETSIENSREIEFEITNLPTEGKLSSGISSPSIIEKEEIEPEKPKSEGGSFFDQL